MVRENNKKEKAQEEDMPEFGAGSEYGKAQRDEAKRKKYGFVSKKYNPDAQPWLMRVGNKKEGKHFRGVREGGVSENTCYYVFTHAQDGSFEAHPIKVKPTWIRMLNWWGQGDNSICDLLFFVILISTDFRNGIILHLE